MPALKHDAVGYRLQWPDGASWHGRCSRRLKRPALGISLSRTRTFDPSPHSSGTSRPGVQSLRSWCREISDKVTGVWSLWRIVLDGGGTRAVRILPLFLSDDGRVLGPTARVVWDRLLELDPASAASRSAALVGDVAAAAFEESRRRAEEAGRPLYDELVSTHRRGLDQENQKTTQAFASRRRAIERIGLPQVRAHRLEQLEQEGRSFVADMAVRSAAFPELRAIAVVRVAAEGELA